MLLPPRRGREEDPPSHLCHIGGVSRRSPSPVGVSREPSWLNFREAAALRKQAKRAWHRVLWACGLGHAAVWSVQGALPALLCCQLLGSRGRESFVDACVLGGCHHLGAALCAAIVQCRRKSKLSRERVCARALVAAGFAALFLAAAPFPYYDDGDSVVTKTRLLIFAATRLLGGFATRALAASLPVLLEEARSGLAHLVGNDARTSSGTGASSQHHESLQELMALQAAPGIGAALGFALAFVLALPVVERKHRTETTLLSSDDDDFFPWALRQTVDRVLHASRPVTCEQRSKAARDAWRWCLAALGVSCLASKIVLTRALRESRRYSIPATDFIGLRGPVRSQFQHQDLDGSLSSKSSSARKHKKIPSSLVAAAAAPSQKTTTPSSSSPSNSTTTTRKYETFGEVKENKKSATSIEEDEDNDDYAEDAGEDDEAPLSAFAHKQQQKLLKKAATKRRIPVLEEDASRNKKIPLCRPRDRLVAATALLSESAFALMHFFGCVTLQVAMKLQPREATLLAVAAYGGAFTVGALFGALVLTGAVTTKKRPVKNRRQQQQHQHPQPPRVHPNAAHLLLSQGTTTPLDLWPNDYEPPHLRRRRDLKEAGYYLDDDDDDDDVYDLRFQIAYGTGHGRAALAARVLPRQPSPQESHKGPPPPLVLDHREETLGGLPALPSPDGDERQSFDQAGAAEVAAPVVEAAAGDAIRAKARRRAACLTALAFSVLAASFAAAAVSTPAGRPSSSRASARLTIVSVSAFSAMIPALALLDADALVPLPSTAWSSLTRAAPFACAALFARHQASTRHDFAKRDVFIPTGNGTGCGAFAAPADFRAATRAATRLGWLCLVAAAPVLLCIAFCRMRGNGHHLPNMRMTLKPARASSRDENDEQHFGGDDNNNDDDIFDERHQLLTTLNTTSSTASTLPPGTPTSVNRRTLLAVTQLPQRRRSPEAQKKRRSTGEKAPPLLSLPTAALDDSRRRTLTRKSPLAAHRKQLQQRPPTPPGNTRKTKVRVGGLLRATTNRSARQAAPASARGGGGGGGGADKAQTHYESFAPYELPV